MYYMHTFQYLYATTYDGKKENVNYEHQCR